MGIFDFLAPDVGGSFGQQRQLANKGLKNLKSSQRDAVADIGRGYDQAQGYYSDAAEAYEPILEDRNRATEMYYNSLGLNGQEGYDAALGAFQQGPGFQTALDMANQNVLRNNAAMGGVASGNTGIALSDRARGLQNLEFGGWQDRLHGLDNLPAANASASALQALGNQFTGEGTATANARLGFAPLIQGQYNNQASLLGQQDIMKANQSQQGISNALGLAGMFTGFLGA